MEYATFNIWVNIQRLSDLNKNRYWRVSISLDSILKPKLQEKERQKRLTEKVGGTIEYEVCMFLPLLDEVES
jgi:hypothetical protein